MGLTVTKSSLQFPMDTAHDTVVLGLDQSEKPRKPSPQDDLNLKIPTGRADTLASSSVSTRSFSQGCGARLMPGAGAWGQVTLMRWLPKSLLPHNMSPMVPGEVCP